MLTVAPLSGATGRKRPLRILCLGAHSDDIEIGCGGTLLSLLTSGRAVDLTFVVLSANGIRATEAENSAIHYLNMAKTAELRLLSFTDGYFPAEWKGIKDVLRAIAAARSVREPYDLVFTHRRDDRHQDHRVISELTANHWRSQPIIEYEIPKYDGDLTTPNLYVPLSAAQARKKTALLQKYFVSQRRKHWFDPALFLGLMRVRGIECAAPGGYAEGFHARKLTFGW